ncbi:MAG: diadenylate cyclase CdaA [Firmicutes bacterium]|nr:diadenylate cyclase CdaA [Bacillota bacterium]MBQ6608756.1 diadenylate cyclase CdaA [Bacillota bacterium]MBR3259972.1 diadenylate cyclase CdaA [Bacillota bacterium]MBR3374894.1 diadenylate cyclase CdaA [Bacillota bacterium]MBR4024258.1 diadenylate cyclase CdaA [Bacillota bacterium]
MNQFFQNIVSNIGVNDVLDILIVAFLFYKLLGFIRETRAEQLAKGLLVLVLVALAASWLHLYTLQWILSNLVNVGLIAIVIIFQPELRRLLENLGRNKLISNFSGIDLEEAEEITIEIREALLSMSKSRTGALIVFERETTLTDIIETGTLIQAGISREMIGNIFYEGAPLHDGALIVRGDKLWAAGCVLPLTEDKKLSKELGTRHRAGIGITENSDALVFIVSEETGIISKAENGKLERNLNAARIDELLQSVYIAPDKDSLPDRITKVLKGGRKNA